MRAVIVAALLATAAFAHCHPGVRSCNGLSNNLGLCSTTSNGFAALCGAFSHSNYMLDELVPVDHGCFNIRAAYAQIRDSNGTVAVEGSFNGPSASATSGVLPWRCSHNREMTAYCTKDTENNGTYLGASSSVMASLPSHFSSNGAYKYSSSVSVDIAFIAARQDFTMYYDGTDKSISVGRGSPLMQLTITPDSSLFSSMASSYMSDSESLWVLFQMANMGGSATTVSYADGDRISASGASFLSKYVSTTGTYVAPVGSAPGYMTYDHTWSSPQMKVLERYELNADTWKYEKRQYLAVKVTHKMETYVATVPKAGMDSGVAQLASLAAAAVAAIVTLMMATA